MPSAPSPRTPSPPPASTRPILASGRSVRLHTVLSFGGVIRGFGGFPLDVRGCHIEALAADGHKWVLGPAGWGILYGARHLQARVAPVEFGWTNVSGYADY